MAAKEDLLADSDDEDVLDPKVKTKKKKEKVKRAPKPKPVAPPPEPKPEPVPKIKNVKQKGKRKGWIVPVVLLLLIIGTGVAVVGFNVFGIRDKYLTGILRNIPIVSNLLPAENSSEEDPYDGKTPEELKNEIERLKLEIAEKDENYNTLLDKNNRNIRELDNLKDIESQYEQFSSDKAEFDELIGLKDPQAYAKFYESIDPVNAERIYAEAVKQNAANAEIKKYVATFTEMDATAAARILDSMTATGPDLVVNIFINMPTANRAEILAEMSVENATVIARRMSSVFDTE